jgi:hypothetical protein
MNLTQVIAF